MQEINWGGLPPEIATEAEYALPAGFWSMPETFIDNAKLRDLYEVLYEQLRRENPEADIIETMMIERAAALYTYMRSIEATEGYANSTSYRQLASLWNQMANDLRKTRNVNFDEARIRAEITKECIEVINSATRGFDPQMANTVRTRLIRAIEAMD